jgi:hypothetical protein
MVAVHPTGEWLVAAGWRGTVHLITLNKGVVDKVYTYKSPVQGLKILACALARQSDRFIAGGERKVYLFTKASMMDAGGPHPVDQVDTPNGGTSDDVRWMAMSGDGTLVTVVQNLGHDIAGLLLTFECDGQQLRKLRKPKVLRFNPNSTSIDDNRKFITVADGHPVGTPGTFYVLDANSGEILMQKETRDMNWPMVLSANGAAAIAGSDTGEVFYFDPHARRARQASQTAAEPVLTS